MFDTVGFSKAFNESHVCPVWETKCIMLDYIAKKILSIAKNGNQINNDNDVYETVCYNDKMLLF